MIHQLREEGLSISAIARRVGMERKTVRKYLKAGLTAPNHKTLLSTSAVGGLIITYLPSLIHSSSPCFIFISLANSAVQLIATSSLGLCFENIQRCGTFVPNYGEQLSPIGE